MSQKRNKIETWEEFCDRIGYNPEGELPKDRKYLQLANFIHFQTVYVNEQCLNWRRNILRIERLLQGIENKYKDEK